MKSEAKVHDDDFPHFYFLKYFDLACTIYITYKIRILPGPKSDTTTIILLNTTTKIDTYIIHYTLYIYIYIYDLHCGKDALGVFYQEF
jgi:hypothetical protein